MTTLMERFWDNVDTDGECWLWTGRTSRGYGKFDVGGRGLRAHRFAYEALVGSIPPGLVVRHRCDTPTCVNPAHLLLGTQKQNVQDALDRGRRRRADLAHGTKATYEWEQRNGIEHCRPCRDAVNLYQRELRRAHANT